MSDSESNTLPKSLG